MRISTRYIFLGCKSYFYIADCLAVLLDYFVLKSMPAFFAPNLYLFVGLSNNPN